jgi:hypothetical protein
MRSDWFGCIRMNACMRVYPPFVVVYYGVLIHVLCMSCIPTELIVDVDDFKVYFPLMRGHVKAKSVLGRPLQCLWVLSDNTSSSQLVIHQRTQHSHLRV